MCLNYRWIKNPYSGQNLYVKCGSCPSCLQEKAVKRVSRIQYSRNAGDDLVCLFSTLTFTNDCIPYIKRSEYNSFVDGTSKYFCVYRDSKLDNHGKLIHQLDILRRFTFDDFYNEEYVFKETSDHLVGLRFKQGNVYCEDFERVGVSLYSDAQNFIKRLRQRLRRVYHYERSWNYFICSEYGSKFSRPHFHVLFFVRKGDESIFFRAVLSSWPFYDCTKISRKDVIDYAIKPAKYVASYVNCISDIPQLLQTKVFRPTCRFSYGLGFNNIETSYDTICKKIEERNLRVSKRICINGVDSDVAVPLPKYIINRYFYKFKGFSKLAPSEIFDIISSRGKRLSLYARKLGLNTNFDRYVSNRPFSKRDFFHEDEIKKVRRFIEKKCLMYGNTEIDLYDYALNYSRVWDIYYSNNLVDSYELYDSLADKDKIEFYYNISDYFENKIRSPTLDYLGELYFECQKDFNLTNQNIISHNITLGEYYRHRKSRRLNSRIYKL